MCVICSSAAGVRQPNLQEITNCFVNNPDGAGFMFARDGIVEIRKGYMRLVDFLDAVNDAALTADTSAVYHFRISTQAGVKPEMTQPFPWSPNLSDMEKLHTATVFCGICHNGIIRLTSDPKQKRYSDTALYITQYLTDIIIDSDGVQDTEALRRIYSDTCSKWALLNYNGNISLIGDFIRDSSGLYFSNSSYKFSHRLL